eukprot:TRINITY_DN1806_c0_g1_i1.p1 TRINITY_DN1806_c0_g1~~TRINITY_DN1806_c0_g1_i1.p1  ORF type:complete len:158 (-),score=30.42 TRINITY_DN1806_c0_g1_i1:40-513(-)
MKKNVNFNYPNDEYKNVNVFGHLWGDDVQNLIKVIQNNENEFNNNNNDDSERELYDLILLADCVFFHSEHKKLLQNCYDCLNKDGICLVSFSHHQPALKERDLNFFTIAKNDFGFNIIEKITTNEFELIHGETDHDNPNTRRSVYLYVLQLTKEQNK